MSVPDAAVALDVSVQRVRQMLTEDPPKLRGLKFGRDWLVDRKSVDEVVNQRRASLEASTADLDALDARGGVW